MPLAEMKLPQDLAAVSEVEASLSVPKEPKEVVKSPCGVVEPRPERVVTTITRLVLSPYSAGGAPSITSIDCTASDGS